MVSLVLGKAAPLFLLRLVEIEELKSKSSAYKTHEFSD
jgi:hypothetical protein